MSAHKNILDIGRGEAMIVVPIGQIYYYPEELLMVGGVVLSTPGFLSSQQVGKRSSTYAAGADSRAFLVRVLEELSLTSYQAARLLQVRPHSHFYDYMAGRSRPSALYLTRLGWLWVLQCEGVSVYHMRGIDWTLGQVMWRNGSVGRLGDPEPLAVVGAGRRAHQGETVPKSAPYHRPDYSADGVSQETAAGRFIEPVLVKNG